MYSIAPGRRGRDSSKDVNSLADLHEREDTKKCRSDAESSISVPAVELDSTSDNSENRDDGDDAFEDRSESDEDMTKKCTVV